MFTNALRFVKFANISFVNDSRYMVVIDVVYNRSCDLIQYKFQGAQFLMANLIVIMILSLRNRLQ